MEYTVRPRRNSFIPENPSWCENSHRRLIIFHIPDLYGRCMCPKENIRILLNEKSILHISCRVIFWEIQSCKVMPIVFNFRTVCNGKTNGFEDVNDFIFYKIDRVARAQLQWKSRSRKIFLFDNKRTFRRCFKLFDFPVYRLFQSVDLLAGILFLFVRNLFQKFIKIIQNAFFSGKADSELLDFVLCRRLEILYFYQQLINFL